MSATDFEDSPSLDIHAFACCSPIVQITALVYDARHVRDAPADVKYLADCHSMRE